MIGRGCRAVVFSRSCQNKVISLSCECRIQLTARDDQAQHVRLVAELLHHRAVDNDLQEGQATQCAIWPGYPPYRADCYNSIPQSGIACNKN